MFETWNRDFHIYVRVFSEVSCVLYTRNMAKLYKLKNVQLYRWRSQAEYKIESKSKQIQS